MIQQESKTFFRETTPNKNAKPRQRFRVVWRLVSRGLAIIALFLVIPLFAQGAILYLEPAQGEYYQGDTFIVEVKLDTEGEEINTAQVNLKFHQDLLEAVDFSKGNSILALWPEEPNFSNQEGVVSFIGGIPGGYQGNGLLGKIIFRVVSRNVSRSLAQVVFKDDSKVLLNDGQGTEARLNFSEGNYEIIEKPEGLPLISSKTHPDQNKWYQGTTLSLYWDLVEGAEYSWILSRDPLIEPDEIPDEPLPKEGVAFWMGAMEYDLKGEGDGIYYFHLRERRGIDAEQDAEPRGRWGLKVTFRVMIDATPPEEFEPQIAEIGGEKYLVFLTKDETSGVEYYEVAEVRPIAKLREILSGETTLKWKRGKSPYLLEDQSLKSKILVRAIDKAGNERIAEIRPPYRITWADVVILLSALIGIGIIWRIIKNVKSKTKNAKQQFKT